MMIRPSLTYRTEANVYVTVSFERNDGQRTYYSYDFVDPTSGRVLGSGDDLSIAGDCNFVEAVRSLASFLGAWCEAHRYGDDAENLNLFSMDLDAADWEQVEQELGDAFDPREN